MPQHRPSGHGYGHALGGQNPSTRTHCQGSPAPRSSPSTRKFPKIIREPTKGHPPKVQVTPRKKGLPQAPLGLPCGGLETGSVFEPMSTHTAQRTKFLAQLRKAHVTMSSDSSAHKSSAGPHVPPCTRCLFSANQKRVCQAANIPGQPGATWAEERPKYMGGMWGLGCRLCAWHLASKSMITSSEPLKGSQGAPSKDKQKTAQTQEKRTNTAQSARNICKRVQFSFSKKESGAKRLLFQPKFQPGLRFGDPCQKKFAWQRENGRHPRFNKFARFAFQGPVSNTRILLQRIRAHNTWAGHKEAQRAFFRHQQQTGPPLAVPLGGPAGPAQGLSQGCALGNPKHDLAKRLLAGRVPTGQDWRDALIDCEEGVALRRAARMACKRKADHISDSALRDHFDKTTGNLRKMRRKQYRVMSEVVRSDARGALRKATSCTMSLDGSAGRKLVIFRCDLPQPPWYQDGVIGLLDENAFKNLAEFTTDHADRAALKFDELLARFCTPLAAELDQDLKDHILKIVLVISADGCAAERRAMFLAAERAFENVIDLIRDPAHAIRIAMQALRKDDFFKEMWDELFDNKHSLVSSGHLLVWLDWT